MKISLRDYQVAAFERTRELIRQKKKRILIVSPTGSGKSVIAAACLEMIAAKGNTGNFIVDRLTLVGQISRMLDSYGIDHGVIQGDHERFRPHLPIQVVSVHTVNRRKQWPASKVDIVDEGHILYQGHKQRMAATSGITLGLTATPFTKGLGTFFDAVINVETTRNLIKQGWLVPYWIYSCVEPDMTGVRVVAGEWEEKETSKRALKVVGDVVAEYVKHGGGRKFICSGVDVVHCQELQRQFLAAGINVATYTYKDKTDDRAEVLDEFRKPDSLVRGLITVTAASRGFDQPDVSCIIMARPLRKSLAEHIQLLGRGLRIDPANGKEDCLVLCHSGNANRFFADTEDFFDNGCAQLDDGKPKPKVKRAEEDNAVKCPSCGHLHKRMPYCPRCGHQYPAKAPIKHVPGELHALNSRTDMQTARDLWPQVCGYVREKSKGDGTRDAKKAIAIFVSLTGKLPRGLWYDSTKPIAPEPQVRKRIISSQIRYAYSKKNRTRPGGSRPQSGPGLI